MDKIQQETYERYTEMFSTPIWKEWLTTVQQYKDAVVTKAPYEIDTEFKAGIVNGTVNVLDMVLNLEVSMTQNVEETEEEEEK